MRRTVLRFLACAAATFVATLAIMAGFAAPARAQGLSLPPFVGGIGVGGGGFGRRYDRGPRLRIPGLKIIPGEERGAPFSKRGRYGRGEGEMKVEGPSGKRPGRPSRETKTDAPTQHYPKWRHPSRQTNDDIPKGTGSASSDVPCRGKRCGGSPSKTPGSASTTSPSSTPCRGRRCGSTGTNSDSASSDAPYGNPPCRGANCSETAPAPQSTPGGDPYGVPCRGRPGCGQVPPDRHPIRPPIVVITPLIPQPPVLGDEPAPSYPRPQRPTPVYEPAAPERSRPPARQVDRTPPPPPPPSAFVPTEAPLPPRRDLALAERPQFRPNELLVTVQGAQPDAVAGQIAATFNLVIEESQAFVLLADRRVYRFSIPDGRPVDAVVAAVAGTPGVAQSAPNFYHFLQGSLGAESLGMQYALPKLRVPDTANLASGRGVSVAVIDSGVDVEHPALKRASITVYDATQSGIKAPDKHGTAIAGIIGARGDIAGIAPGASILAVRAFAPEQLGAAPSTTSLTLARATDMAFAYGARVFNMSFAGPRDPLLLSLIDSAFEKGAVFIAAAGNEGPKAAPAFPAAYDKVIGITATDEDDGLYAMANRGSYVSVAAPGVDILVPVTGSALDYMSGTSFAAAHITGIVALLLERNPQLGPEDIREILLRAAHDLGAAGQDDDFGAGLADAYEAVMLAAPKLQSSINP